MNDKKKPAVADTERRYYALVHPSADLGRPVKGVIDLDADPEPHYYHFSDKDLLRKELTEDFEPGEILFLSDIGQKLPENHSTILDTGDFVVTGSRDSRDVNIWSRVSEVDILKRVRRDYDVVTGAQSEYSDLVEDIAYRHMEELKNERSQKEMDDIAHALGDGFTWRAKVPTSTGDAIPFRLSDYDYDIGEGYSKAITAISARDGKLDIEVSDLSVDSDENYEEGWTFPGKDYINPHKAKMDEIEPEEWVEEIIPQITDRFKTRIDEVVSGRISNVERTEIIASAHTGATTRELDDDSVELHNVLDALRKEAKHPGSTEIARLRDYGIESAGYDHAYSFEYRGSRYDFVSNPSEGTAKGYGSDSIRIRRGGEYTDMTSANYHISSAMYNELDYAIGKAVSAHEKEARKNMSDLKDNIFTSGVSAVPFLGNIRLSDGRNYKEALSRMDYDGNRKVFVRDAEDGIERNLDTMIYDDRRKVYNATIDGIAGARLMSFLNSNAGKEGITFPDVYRGHDGRAYTGIREVNLGLGPEYALIAGSGKPLPVRDLATGRNMDNLLHMLLLDKISDNMEKNINPDRNRDYHIPVSASFRDDDGAERKISELIYKASDAGNTDIIIASGTVSRSAATESFKVPLANINTSQLEAVSASLETYFREQEEAKRQVSAYSRLSDMAVGGRWHRERQKTESASIRYAELFDAATRRIAHGEDIISKDRYAHWGGPRNDMLLTLLAMERGYEPVFADKDTFEALGAHVREGADAFPIVTYDGVQKRKFIEKEVYATTQTDIKEVATRDDGVRKAYDALRAIQSRSKYSKQDLENIVKDGNWPVPIVKSSPEEMEAAKKRNGIERSGDWDAFYASKDDKVYVKGRPQDANGSDRRAFDILTALINSHKGARLGSYNTAITMSMIEYDIDPDNLTQKQRGYLNVIDSDLNKKNPDYVRSMLNGGELISSNILAHGTGLIKEERTIQEETSQKGSISLSDQEVSKENEQESQEEHRPRGLRL